MNPVVLSLEGFMKVWSYVLFGGGWMILVLTIIALWTFTAIKIIQIGTRLINRYFERKMRNGHITRAIKKTKKAVVKHFALKEVRKRNAAQNGKEKIVAENKL